VAPKIERVVRIDVTRRYTFAGLSRRWMFFSWV
jgi:hypothetical protein